MADPSFDAVYADTKDRVWPLCCRMLGKDGGEDAMQEIYTLVFRFLPGFEGRSSVDTWVYRIAVNYLIHARKRRAARMFSNEVPELAIVEANTGDLLDAVGRCIADMDHDSAQVATLVLLDGCSQTEAARILELPVGTVYSRLFRAKEKIRQHLKRAGHEFGTAG